MVNLNEIKLSGDTNWAFRKLSTKMQNAHTRKTVYTFFVFYNWSTKKTEPTVFQNQTEPAIFLKTEPNLTCFCSNNFSFSFTAKSTCLLTVPVSSISTGNTSQLWVASVYWGILQALLFSCHNIFINILSFFVNSL